jgi:hypothetical protein
LQAVFRFATDFISLLFQQKADEIANGGVVVDDEKPGHTIFILDQRPASKYSDSCIGGKFPAAYKGEFLIDTENLPLVIFGGMEEAALSTYANVTIQVACPKCQRNMLLRVGLSSDTSNNMLECPDCHDMFVPLVLGPVIRGPYQVDEPRLKKQKSPVWMGFFLTAS